MSRSTPKVPVVRTSLLGLIVGQLSWVGIDPARLDRALAQRRTIPRRR